MQMCWMSSDACRRTGTTPARPPSDAGTAQRTTARLACVVFTGTARRLPPPDADALYARWPLLPPLAVLYPTAAARADFTAWRLVPDRVQVVSIPDALGGGARPDWRAPELERRADGGWDVVCSGGMQGHDEA